MFNSRTLTTHLATVALLAFGALASVYAADDLIKSKDAVCTSSLDANNSLVASIKDAKDDDAIRTLLAPSIKANPTNALCIMDIVKAQAPTQSRRVFQIIIALLATDPANDPIIKRLTDDHADIIAQIGTDVEPAAGPGDTGNTQDNPAPAGNPENPSQLNEQDATTPPASPSEPR